MKSAIAFLVVQSCFRVYALTIFDVTCAVLSSSILQKRSVSIPMQKNIHEKTLDEVEIVRQCKYDDGMRNMTGSTFFARSVLQVTEKK